MENSFRQSPKRAPHWQWLRAVEIDQGGRAASRRLDGPAGFINIRRALRLKRHYDRAGSNPDRLYALMLRDEPLFWAHSMWRNDKEPMRWTVEARVIAGETDEEIAEKLGVETAVVQAYNDIFFNVREKLNNFDYVVNVMFNDAVTRGLQERQYDLLWKMVAYQGGTHALNAILGRFISIPKPRSADEVAGFFQDSAINSVKYKAALATMTVPVNTHTQLQLIDSFVKYIEVERTTDNATKAQHSIIDNIGAMLRSMPLKIGTKLESKEAKVLPYDDSAAELRGDEIIAAASGAKIDEAQTIQQLKFPGDA